MTHLIALQSFGPVLLGFPNHVYLLKLSAMHCPASFKCSAKLFLNKQNNKSQKKP